MPLCQLWEGYGNGTATGFMPDIRDGILSHMRAMEESIIGVKCVRRSCITQHLITRKQKMQHNF